MTTRIFSGGGGLGGWQIWEEDELSRFGSGICGVGLPGAGFSDLSGSGFFQVLGQIGKEDQQVRGGFVREIAVEQDQQVLDE